MAEDSPAARDMAKKVLFTASRLGRPKEILDTPMTVWMPLAFKALITARSMAGLRLSVLTVRARGSMMISFALIPY